MAFWLLCLVGFSKELRPTTPYLTPFLIDDKNLTDQQLYSQVYPYWTYSYLFCLLPVFALTDLVQYKPLIQFEVISLVIVWALLIWGYSLRIMQLMQVIFGVATACEVAYYSYIYASAAKHHYWRLTGYVRAAALAGKCFAYALSQVLVLSLTSYIYTYDLLNYITIGSLTTSAVLVMFLPNIRKVKDIQDKNGTDSELLDIESKSKKSGYCVNIKSILKTVKENYANSSVIKWSLFWVISTSIHYQVGNYIQALWALNQNANQPWTIYNGLCETLNTGVGALVSLIIMTKIRLNWRHWGDLYFSLSAMMLSGLLFTISLSNNVFVQQITYIAFTAVFYACINVAMGNLALEVKPGSHGAMVSANTFVAVALQTILTMLIIDARTPLQLPLNEQFFVYAISECGLAIVFLVFCLISIYKQGIRTYIKQLTLISSTTNTGNNAEL